MHTYPQHWAGWRSWGRGGCSPGTRTGLRQPPPLPCACAHVSWFLSVRMRIYYQWWARAMNSCFTLECWFFKKQLKVSLYLEPFISTEHLFLKHLVQFNRSLVYKCQREFHFFTENQRFKKKWLILPFADWLLSVCACAHISHFLSAHVHILVAFNLRMRTY